MTQVHKNLIAFALFLMFLNTGFGITLNIQENYPFHYYLEDVAGNHVGSQTINIKVIRGSDLYVLDHNDDTFKNTGWTTKITPLTEDATEELYYYTFNPPSSETGAETYDLQIDNSDATYGVHIGETITYQDIGTSDFASGGDVNVTTIEGVDATDAINTQADTAFTDYDPPTNAELTTAVSNIRGVDSDTLKTLSDQLDTVITDTGELQVSLADGGFTDLLIDSILADTGEMQAAQNWNVWDDAARTITGLTAAALADFFDTDSGTTYSSAVAGSVVKESADNAGGATLTVSSIVDGVWNELVADHNAVSGSFAEMMSDIGDATDGNKESSLWTGIELLITAGI